jgi:dephospho-CoA kinase
MRLGLTGGIGSGKSTVARTLVERGALLIDADAIARTVTAAGGAAIAAIQAQFGAAFITAQGALDRERMRQLAFADPPARERLQAIVHPLVSAEAARQSASAQSPCIVFDIPLLVESTKWRARLDRILVIDCPVETQIRRVLARSGWTRDAVEGVIAAQATRAQRLAAADLVLYNEGLSLAELAAQAGLIGAGFGL